MRRNKDASTATQAQHAIVSLVALFLIGFVRQESSKRNIIRRFPRPGITTPLLAGLAVLPSCCTDTAALDKTCKMSIVTKDEFGDLTSVSRLGGILHVFCQGGGSIVKYLYVDEGRKELDPLIHTVVVPPNELVIGIGNRSELLENQKAVFAGNPIYCKCGGDRSPGTKYDQVPLPILCGADSQITCGYGKICSVRPDTGIQVCTEAANSLCDTRMQVMKTTMFPCPRLDDPPLMECQNIQQPPSSKWPEFEVLKKHKTECSGQPQFLFIYIIYDIMRTNFLQTCETSGKRKMIPI